MVLEDMIYLYTKYMSKGLQSYQINNVIVICYYSSIVDCMYVQLTKIFHETMIDQFHFYMIMNECAYVSLGVIET